MRLTIKICGLLAISFLFSINLTSEIENNVDHIVMSKQLLNSKNIKLETWNQDKKLSDHIGICISFE